MDFEQLCNERHSVRKYTTGIEICDEELERLFSMVLLGPSSFNIQHWQFVVVRDQNRKSALKDMSFHQAQVADAAAVVLVCGNLQAYQDAERIYGDSPIEVREKYVPMIMGSYQDQPALQRDEVIRSGSMAAMSLMYAAKSLGWDSGPMIGFDAAKVADFLRLGKETIPVMMIVIGKALNDEQPERGHRRAIAEVVKLESAEGLSLGA